MKRIVLLLVMSGLIGFGIGWCLEVPPKREVRDFDIYQSFIHEGADYKSTYLYVIVNKKEYTEDEIYDSIIDFHAKMNEVSNELTIRLYESKEALSDGKCISEQVFYNN